MRLQAAAGAIAFSVVLSVCRVTAQIAPPDLLGKGLEQLNAARAARTDAAYQAAEDTFTMLLVADPSHAQALAYRGSARVMRGVLSLSTSLQEAMKRFQSGMADMDRAVTLAPGDGMVRLTRGLSYIEFPPFYNKQGIAREDLEVATSHPDFETLPPALRRQAERALERASTSVDPSSGATRLDRFGQVPDATSPVIAVASVTFERMHLTGRPAWLKTIMDALHRSPGMLGAHTAMSVDHPGMFLIFTWWTNKQALNDFYYSDAHQGWIRGREKAIAGVGTRAYVETGPSQVGIELLSTLPGGMTLGGGFVPRSVR
jgi:quinol monooxygenase YgiN